MCRHEHGKKTLPAVRSSSDDSTRSTSRMGTNFSSTLPMPSRHSTRTAVPNAGGGSMSSGANSTTRLTASTKAPITFNSPSSSTSAITTQVVFVMAVSPRPNFTARSTTGTTLPRRFITPRIQAGVVGTGVNVSNSKISRRRRMFTAYSAPPRKNVRHCVGPSETLVSTGESSSGSTKSRGSVAATGATDSTGSTGSTGSACSVGSTRSLGAAALAGGGSWLSDALRASFGTSASRGLSLRVFRFDRLTRLTICHELLSCSMSSLAASR